MNDYQTHPLVRQCGAHKVFGWLRSGAIAGKRPADFGFPGDFNQDPPERSRAPSAMLHGKRIEMDIADDTGVDMSEPGEYKAVVTDVSVDGQGVLTVKGKLPLPLPPGPATHTSVLTIRDGENSTEVLFTDEFLAVIGDGFQAFLVPLYQRLEHYDGLEDPTAFGKTRTSRKDAMASAQRKSKKRGMKEHYVIVAHAGTIVAAYFQGSLVDQRQTSFKRGE